MSTGLTIYIFEYNIRRSIYMCLFHLQVAILHINSEAYIYIRSIHSYDTLFLIKLNEFAYDIVYIVRFGIRIRDRNIHNVYYT